MKNKFTCLNVMRRFFFTAVVLLSVSVLCAQERDSARKFVFPKHEIKISYGDAITVNQIWEETQYKTNFKSNLSISYSYRHKKWLWFGINVVHYIGAPIDYHVREYDVDNNYTDYQYTTKDYGFGLIPAIRFSYLNKENTTLYSGIEMAYQWIQTHTDGVPNKKAEGLSGHVTYFGCSFYLGKSQKVFLGGEMGYGCRGIFNIHAGYRF